MDLLLCHLATYVAVVSEVHPERVHNMLAYMRLKFGMPVSTGAMDG